MDTTGDHDLNFKTCQNLVWKWRTLPLQPVADPGDQRGPKDPTKISHKKMAAESSYIDFILLAPPAQPLDPLLAAPINHYLGSNAWKKGITFLKPNHI